MPVYFSQVMAAVRQMIYIETVQSKRKSIVTSLSSN